MFCCSLAKRLATKHQSVRKLRTGSAFVVFVADVVLSQRDPEVQTIKLRYKNKSECHREGRRSCGLKTIKQKMFFLIVVGLKAAQM